MKNYCNEIATTYKTYFGNFRGTTVPLVNNLKNFNKEETQTNPDPRIQKLIGQILWLTRTARPDLAYSASCLSARITTWDSDCQRELERCVSYIASTSETELVMDLGTRTPGDFNNLRLTCYSDADWNAPKSQSGFFLVWEDPATQTKIPLHWNSKRQTLVTESAAAAEVCAAYTALRETLPMALSINFLPNFTSTILLLRVDNMQVIQLAENGSSSKLFFLHKAANIRGAFLAQAKERGWLAIRHVKSVANPANLMTKPLAKFRLTTESQLCGLRFSHAAQARAAIWRAWTNR